MARLTAPNGSTVNVSDERAKVLLEQGYTSADEKKKAAAKKASSSSKTEK